MAHSAAKEVVVAQGTFYCAKAMFDDGFAPSHDLGIGGHPLGHFLLHFFCGQPGDGTVLFIARTLRLEGATFAATRSVVVDGTSFLVRGKAVTQLLARRTDVTVFPRIILKAFLAIKTARGIGAGQRFGNISAHANHVAGQHLLPVVVALVGYYTEILSF